MIGIPSQPAGRRPGCVAGALAGAALRSARGGACTVRSGDRTAAVRVETGGEVRLDGELLIRGR